jgi:hypothetical protein
MDPHSVAAEVVELPKVAEAEMSSLVARYVYATHRANALLAEMQGVGSATKRAAPQPTPATRGVRPVQYRRR